MTEEPVTDWSALNADVVRLIVNQDLALLPVLYLTSKATHVALAAVHPNAPMWKNYFNFIPGYSDYKPEDDETWRLLVKTRASLVPRFYLALECARLDCGAMAPERMLLGMLLCKCGRFAHRHTVIEWVPTKKQLVKLPISGDPLQFARPGTWVGFTARMAGPAYYTWDAAAGRIWQHEQFDFNSETELKRLAAARADDPAFSIVSMIWHLARYVAIV